MDKIELMQILLSQKAITFSPNKPFTFSSGIQSPIYCDHRVLLSDPVVRKKFVLAYCELIPGGTEQIAAVATAGIPWGAWIAEHTGLPFVYVRSDKKQHGLGHQIEGRLTDQAQTVIIEDLISTAGSSLKVLDALRDAHVHVSQITAIFTYQFEDTQHALKESEIKAKTILELKDLIAYAKDQGRLNDQEVISILAWQKDPNSWSARKQ